MEQITILGDIHGNFKELEKSLQSIKSEFIFQCGDFGIFPKFHNKIGIIPNREYNFKLITDKRIYFCPGNHEDWDYLDSLSCNEIFNNVYYMRKCSTLTIDNTNILFIGGAESKDKNKRILGIDYFNQELLNRNDIDSLPNIPIDIVISHTCPSKIFPIISKNLFYTWDEINDPSRIVLDIVFEKYKPRYWFFGHFHNSMSFKFEGCNFEMLNLIGRSGWATSLNLWK